MIIIMMCAYKKLFLLCVIASLSNVSSASSPACSSSSLPSSSSSYARPYDRSCAFSVVIKDEIKKAALTKELKRLLSMPFDDWYKKDFFKNVKQLIKDGADVNVKLNDRGITPLMRVAQKNKRDMCSGEYVFDLMLEVGADLLAQDAFGKTVYDYCSGQEKYTVLFCRLVRDVALLCSEGKWCDIGEIRKAMADCAYHPFKNIESYDDIMSQDDDWIMSDILTFAIRYNRISDTRLLLNSRALHFHELSSLIIINNMQNSGYIDYRCNESTIVNWIQMLIDCGRAKINERDGTGCTLLEKMLHDKRKFDCVGLLLANGAAVDRQDLCKYYFLNSDLADKDCSFSDYLMLKALKHNKPIRQVKDTDEDFECRMDKWKRHVKYGPWNNPDVHVVLGWDDCETIESYLGSKANVRFNKVMAQRAQLAAGGNMLQLLQQREQGGSSLALLKQRLTNRINISEMPSAGVGDIVVK